jgi:hypothetical protein
MRIVSGICCFLMLLFAFVQVNDPDVLNWVLIYGIVALWCGLAAFRPAMIKDGWGRRLLVLCLALGAIGVVWYFPKTPGFWQTEVWWITETAREGMGMMVAFAALTVAWFAANQSP